MADFQDITIKGYNRERSEPIEGTPLFRICMELSSLPPEGWEDIFNSHWKTVGYSLKRKATADQDAIWLDCPPEEVKREHLGPLSDAVAQTNQRYQDHLKRAKLKSEFQRQENDDNQRRLDALEDDMNT